VNGDRAYAFFFFEQDDTLFSSIEAGNISSSSANKNTHKLGTRINLGRKASSFSYIITYYFIVLFDSGHREFLVLFWTVRYGMTYRHLY
jgi:hypothetical protein